VHNTFQSAGRTECPQAGALNIRAALCLLVGVTAIVSLMLSSLHAENSERKLVYRVAPVYPQDLKKFRLSGTVRLEVIISPRGSVDSVALVGGNPMFEDAAVAAVKKWRYTPAETKTRLQIEVVFNPDQ
jgi:TonB family protein